LVFWTGAKIVAATGTFPLAAKVGGATLAAVNAGEPEYWRDREKRSQNPHREQHASLAIGIVAATGATAIEGMIDTKESPVLRRECPLSVYAAEV
jgi:hypothetical protein